MSTQAPNESQQQTPGPNGEVDPLERLHKMSRTAGVGTQEYVAVNSVSVAALLLGVASALAVLDRIMLVVPLAAIVCAIIALYQIAHSNGTQTGRLLAWGGLLLAMLFTVGQVTRQVTERAQTRNDRQAIMHQIAAFGQKLASEDFDGAYAMTGERFKKRVPAEQFTNLFKARFRHPAHGKVTSMRSNGLVDFQPDERGANRIAASNAIVELEHSKNPDRQPMTFTKIERQWVIEDLPGWFPATSAPGRPSRAN
jgi:hypothetical protein